MQDGNLRGRAFRQSDNPMYMTSKNSAEAAYRARRLIASGLVAKERGVPAEGPPQRVLDARWSTVPAVRAPPVTAPF